MKDILKAYEDKRSIKGAAKKLKVSEGTVRKTLITEGAIELSPIDIRIKETLSDGKTQKAATAELKLSKSTVSAHPPYIRRSYLDPEKTHNAINIAKFRRKKEQENNEKI